MELALMIAHVVFSVILIIVVLLQKSKEAGLSGAVGGANGTFFGKNKGRTVDAMLKKLTGVFAILFIITSLALAYVSTRPAEPAAPVTIEQNANNAATDVKVDADANADVNVDANADTNADAENSAN